VPVNSPISLCAGYNLVGYLPNWSINVADALWTIEGAYDSVMGFDPTLGAQSFYPGLPAGLNSLTQMEPGRGYWIKMREPRTLIYP
jgi:hypothetical protein